MNATNTTVKLPVEHLMFPAWVTTLEGVAIRGHQVSWKEFQGLWCRLRKRQALLEKEPYST